MFNMTVLQIKEEETESGNSYMIFSSLVYSTLRLASYLSQHGFLFLTLKSTSLFNSPIANLLLLRNNRDLSKYKR